MASQNGRLARQAFNTPTFGSQAADLLLLGVVFAKQGRIFYPPDFLHDNTAVAKADGVSSVSDIVRFPRFLHEIFYLPKSGRLRLDQLSLHGRLAVGASFQHALPVARIADSFLAGETSQVRLTAACLLDVFSAGFVVLRLVQYFLHRSPQLLHVRLLSSEPDAADLGV